METPTLHADELQPPPSLCVDEQLHLGCIVRSPPRSVTAQADPMIQEGEHRMVARSPPPPLEGSSLLASFLDTVTRVPAPPLIPAPLAKATPRADAPVESVTRRCSARLAKDGKNTGTIMQKATTKIARELNFLEQGEVPGEETLKKLVLLFKEPLTQAVIEGLALLAGTRGRVELPVSAA